MNERRASRRLKSFLRGVVYFDKRRSETACLVRDLSEDGARIILSETIAIPDIIELKIPQREQTLAARVEWRRPTKPGCPSASPIWQPRRGRLNYSGASPSSKPKLQRFSAPSGASSGMATAGSKRHRR